MEDQKFGSQQPCQVVCTACNFSYGGSSASGPHRHLYSRTTCIIKDILNLKNKDQAVSAFSQKPFLWEHSLYDVCVPDYLPNRPTASEDRTTLYAFISSQPSTLSETHEELNRDIPLPLGIGPALDPERTRMADLRPPEKSSLYPSQHPHSWSTRSAKSEDGSLSHTAALTTMKKGAFLGSGCWEAVGGR